MEDMADDGEQYSTGNTQSEVSGRQLAFEFGHARLMPQRLASGLTASQSITDKAPRSETSAGKLDKAAYRTSSSSLQGQRQCITATDAPYQAVGTGFWIKAEA